jgi:hypothetical protein
MRIGIEINGVLRDTISKFKQLYEKNLIDNNSEEQLQQTFNINNDGDLTPNEQNNLPFKYEVKSEVDSLDLMNHFSFPSKDDLFSFMYEEYTMEIFGHSPSTEMNTFNLLNDFYYEFREKNDLLIVSDEIGKSKPSSLFFLSKFGCLIEEIFFYSQITKKSMWNKIDILLTANPDLLLNHPNGKVLIKFETDYNKHINSEFKIKSLSELKNTIEKIENVYNF